MKNKFGIYIHIPFCKSKCYYCDFVSYTGKENSIRAYFDALKKEIKEDINTHKKNVSTIYFGGGTPSLVDSKYIRKILTEIYAHYNSLEDNLEITLEINPTDIEKSKLDDYKEMGINRISIGLQSTEDKELRLIGRTHLYKNFLDTFSKVRQAGFDNVSVDLMFSLPEQDKKSLYKSIYRIIELDKAKGGIKHISLYSLILEKETNMYKYYRDNNIIQNDKKDREMYHEASKILEENGYKRYELSNFAKVGYESKHNIDCWEYAEYRGFGSGASSFIGSVRFKNTENIDKYIEYVYEGQSPIIEKDNLKKQREIEDYIMLGLRMEKGFNIKLFEERFKILFKEHYKEELKFLEDNALIKIDDNIRLTDRGFDIMNSVIMYFFQ